MIAAAALNLTSEILAVLIMVFAGESCRLGLWRGRRQSVTLQGFLDPLSAGDADALVDGERLLEVHGGLAGVASMQVALAESFQGTRFLKGCAEVTGDS